MTARAATATVLAVVAGVLAGLAVAGCGERRDALTATGAPPPPVSTTR